MPATALPFDFPFRPILRRGPALVCLAILRRGPLEKGRTFQFSMADRWHPGAPKHCLFVVKRLCPKKSGHAANCVFLRFFSSSFLFLQCCIDTFLFANDRTKTTLGANTCQIRFLTTQQCTIWCGIPHFWFEAVFFFFFFFFSGSFDLNSNSNFLWSGV